MSIAIDPHAGTHFTGKIFVVPHACDRAVEHFRVERSQAPMYVMDMLRKAVLVDDKFVGEDGNESRLFAYQRTAFVVDRKEATVITLYPQYKANAAILDPVQRILTRTLKAAQRKEVRETKRINVRKAELNVKRAEYALRLAKTESRKVAEMMKIEISGIDDEIAILERELVGVKRERANIAKSIVAYL